MITRNNFSLKYKCSGYKHAGIKENEKEQKYRRMSSTRAIRKEKKKRRSRTLTPKRHCLITLKTADY